MRNTNLCISVALGRMFLVLALAASLVNPAFAFPDKIVTLVVPFPAGGVVDILGRMIADKLGPQLGTTVIVTNRPGAGGTLGAGVVARAKPDGNTLLIGGAATHVFSMMYPELPYDPVKDFTPVIQLTTGPLVLVVPQNSPATNFAEFQRLVRSEGDRLNYSSNGPGTFPHLAAELYRQDSGGKFTHVPYPGGSKAILALMSGEIGNGFSINHIPNVIGMTKAGKLRAIATTGSKRSASYPDLPTFAEAGIAGFETSAWFALYAPAGTPKAVVDRLNLEVQKALNSSDLREKLALQGDEVIGGTPEALAGYLKSERSRWGAVVKAANIKPQ